MAPCAPCSESDPLFARPPETWLPDWVSGLGLPVWITGPDRTLHFVNEHAERLFAQSATTCIGRACCDIVAGRDAKGVRFCDARCAVVRAAESDTEIPPHTVEIPHADGTSRWVKLIVIPVRRLEADKPWLVHCAVPIDGEHRLHAFLSRVASRTPHDLTAPGPTTGHRLTRRELEVLELLSQDKGTAAIARELHLSHVTVRNHVQHILEKLDAHSILEAVARYLLRRR